MAGPGEADRLASGRRRGFATGPDADLSPAHHSVVPRPPLSSPCPFGTGLAFRSENASTILHASGAVIVCAEWEAVDAPDHPDHPAPAVAAGRRLGLRSLRIRQLVTPRPARPD